MRSDVKDKVALVGVALTEKGKTFNKWIPFSILGQNENNEIFVEKWFTKKKGKKKMDKYSISVLNDLFSALILV